ncbi:hypothetical protein ACHRV6_21170 [Flavobacterium sp. FlaQc-51]|uniref:hypothetical protein n=1 Tax=Flavobacterium sp. FlaQc-51 TaxID=3374184 RepID=UPI0037573777
MAESWSNTDGAGRIVAHVVFKNRKSAKSKSNEFRFETFRIYKGYQDLLNQIKTVAYFTKSPIS